jgi:hypothetical protein
MFALRGLGQQARTVARLPRQAALLQQKRGMAGGGMAMCLRQASLTYP